MPKDYDIYCPECESENVSVRRVPKEKDRVSMDDLPVKDSSTWTVFEALPDVEKKKATCRDCGYEVTFTVIHDKQTPKWTETDPSNPLPPVRKRWTTGDPVPEPPYRVLCDGPHLSHMYTNGQTA